MRVKIWSASACSQTGLEHPVVPDSLIDTKAHFPSDYFASYPSSFLWECLSRWHPGKCYTYIYRTFPCLTYLMVAPPPLWEGPSLRLPPSVSTTIYVFSWTFSLPYRVLRTLIPAKTSLLHVVLLWSWRTLMPRRLLFSAYQNILLGSQIQWSVPFHTWTTYSITKLWRFLPSLSLSHPPSLPLICPLSLLPSLPSLPPSIVSFNLPTIYATIYTHDLGV